MIDIAYANAAVDLLMQNGLRSGLRFVNYDNRERSWLETDDGVALAWLCACAGVPEAMVFSLAAACVRRAACHVCTYERVDILRACRAVERFFLRDQASAVAMVTKAKSSLPPFGPEATNNATHHLCALALQSPASRPDNVILTLRGAQKARGADGLAGRRELADVVRRVVPYRIVAHCAARRRDLHEGACSTATRASISIDARVAGLEQRVRDLEHR